MDSKFPLYMEVCNLFASAGGAYWKIDKPFFGYLIECLLLEQYFISRDESGEIDGFCIYWFVDDLDGTRSYKRPATITQGRILYVVDSVCRGAIWKQMRHIRSIMKDRGLTSVAWSHRNTGKLAHFKTQVKP